MIKVVGIRFRKAGKIYYFDPAELEIEAGEHVIVETVRGIEYGTAVLGVKEISEEEVVQPLKKVIRLATDEDKELEVKNKEKEREAYEVCLKKIRKHELQMKLIDCEYTFDNNKLLFYFTADGRIDFRELVKDLASVFKTRIELRQIGVRDETKMIGSIGICGRTLCCHAHLSDFHPVSIKMAKDQNLSLNPTKISGVCGRLMCCLKYEEETYQDLNSNLPRVGETVTIRDTKEKAEVINTNIIRQLVKVVIRRPDGDPEITEMKVSDLLLRGRRRRQEDVQVSNEEAKELKKLEALEKEEKGDGKDQIPKNKYNKRKNNQRSNNKQQDNRGNKEQKDRNVKAEKPNKNESKQETKGEERTKSIDSKSVEDNKSEALKAKDANSKPNSGSNKNSNRNNRNRNNRNKNFKKKQDQNQKRDNRAANSEAVKPNDGKGNEVNTDKGSNQNKGDKNPNQNNSGNRNNKNNNENSNKGNRSSNKGNGKNNQRRNDRKNNSKKPTQNVSNNAKPNNSQKADNVLKGE